MALANLLIKIGLDIAQLKTGSDEAVRQMRKTGDKIDSIGGTIVKTLKGVGAAFVIKEVVSFVSNTVNAASRIEDLAKKLSVSTDAVQRWTYGLSLSGGTIDDVDTALSFMNKTLGGGSDSTKQVLKDAGLAFDDIRKMQPEEAFDVITTAIAGIKNPLVQAAVHMALFGRGGGDLLAALKNGFVETAKDAHLWSKETIARLDAAGDAWTKLANVATIASGELISNTIDGFKNLGNAVEDSVSRSFTLLHLDTTKAIEDLQDLKRWMDVIRQTPVFAPTAPGAPKAGGLKPLAAIALSSSEAAEIAANYDRVRKKLDEGAIAAAAYAKAFREGVNEMKGVTAIKAAEEALKRLNAVVLSGIPLQKIDRDERAKLNQVMAAAMDVYIAQGQVVPDSIRKVHNATLDFSKMAIPFVHDYKKALVEAGKAYIPLISAQARWSTSTADWPRIIQPAKIYIPIVGKIRKETDEWAESLAGVSNAFSQLAQIAGPSLSGILRGIGSVAAAFNVASQGMKAVKEGNAAGGASGKMGMIGGLATIASGYGAVAMAAIAAGKAIFKAMNDGRKAVVDFATSSGGFDDLRTKLLVLGDEGERLWLKLTQGTKKGDKAGAQAAVAAITQAFEKQELAVADATSAVASLISASLGSGVVIPPAVQASIDKLIEMGRLTRENASDLLGLSGVGVPSLADVTEAADRYGLKLADLGPKIDQLQITSKADQIIKDWELLSLAGADVGTVMAGMTSKVQPLVDSALKFGRELPDSMRPLLQKMAEAGLLTDATGTKLEDLSTITFTVNPIDALITKIDELIGKITDGIGGALSDLGKTVVRVPIKFDVDDIPGGGSQPPGFAGGTHGRLLNFGPRGKMVVLHGREGVFTDQDVAEGMNLGTGTDGEFTIVNQIVLDGRVIDERAKKVARKDAARGGLRQRAAHGRSY